MSFISDKDYELILSLIPVPTVDIIILNASKEKTLLFKRCNPPLKDHYFSIGGRMYKNETCISTAVRKVKEELCLEISEKELIFGGVQDEIFEDSIYPGVNSHNLNVYFYYTMTNDRTFKLDSQHESHQWFFLDDPAIHPLIQRKLQGIKNEQRQ